MVESTRPRARRRRSATPEILLKRAVFAAALLVLALLIFSSRFYNLETNGADYAQIARNLATGQGFTTSAVTPLGLTVVPRIEHHPELTRPPLWIAVLALAMRIGGVADKTVAVTSLLFLLATTLALYLIVARRLSRTAALWAAFLYFVSVPVLRQSINGLDTTFLSFLVTLLFGALMLIYERYALAAEAGGESGEGAGRVPAGWSLLTGLLVGLCWLTCYDTLLLLVVVLVFWWKLDRRRAWAHSIAALVGFLLLAMPWIIRGSVVAGRPFISLHSYEMLMFTDKYPAQSLFHRFVEVPRVPLLAALGMWPDMVKKFAEGLGALYTDPLQSVNPYVMPFFVVGLFLAVTRRRWVLVQSCLALALALQVLVMCLYQPLARLLLIYSPMVSAFAAFWLVTLVREWAEQVSGLRRRVRRLGLQLDGLALAGFGLLALVPLVLFMFLTPPTREYPGLETLRALSAEKYPVVATDLAWMAAWYGEQPRLALPMGERDWVAMEQAGLTAPAIYLSPTLVLAPAAERMEMWQRLLVTAGNFRDFSRVTSWRYAGLLLAREAAPPASRGR